MVKQTLLTATLGMVLCAGCGDDSQPAGKQDRGAAVSDTSGGSTDTSGGTIDTGGTTEDKGTTAKDGGATSKGCTTPFVAKANSGKPCKDDTECSADEICLSNDTGDGAMCAGKCCADTSAALEAAANACVVPDAAKQKAFCLWSMVDEQKNPLPYMACAFICDYKGTKYTCPNATDTCVQSQNPDVSYCDPAKAS